MDIENVQRLRKTEIEILDYIVDICDKNGLVYYLLYGTLLGAVRHKGFIPWDDDIDIGLPRKDYNKLCILLEELCNNVDSPYFFQSSKTEKNFSLPFSKLRKNGTVFLEKINQDKDIHKGIFVDIFPLDKVKHKKGWQKPFSFLIYRLYKLFKKTRLQFFYKGAQFLESFYEKAKCRYYVCYGSPYKVEKDIAEIEWFQEGKMLIFEGKNYRTPLKYEKYLSNLYGEDYMSLPPVEMRISHNPLLLKFED